MYYYSELVPLIIVINLDNQADDTITNDSREKGTGDESAASAGEKQGRSNQTWAISGRE